MLYTGLIHNAARKVRYSVQVCCDSIELEFASVAQSFDYAADRFVMDGQISISPAMAANTNSASGEMHIPPATGLYHRHWMLTHFLHTYWHMSSMSAVHCTSAG